MENDNSPQTAKGLLARNQDRFGRTCLHLAAQNGHKHVCQHSLFAEGTNYINTTDKKAHWTIFEFCANFRTKEAALFPVPHTVLPKDFNACRTGKIDAKNYLW